MSGDTQVHRRCADAESLRPLESTPAGEATPARMAGEPASEDARPVPAAAGGPPTKQRLSGELLALFTAQCTHELWERVSRYARKAAARVCELGGNGGDALGEELLQDALRDTLEGTLRWDPEAASLESHLVSRIRSRARDERLSFPHFCGHPSSL